MARVASASRTMSALVFEPRIIVVAHDLNMRGVQYRRLRSFCGSAYCGSAYDVQMRTRSDQFQKAQAAPQRQEEAGSPALGVNPKCSHLLRHRVGLREPPRPRLER
jgi:hypothetical protein